MVFYLLYLFYPHPHSIIIIYFFIIPKKKEKKQQKKGVPEVIVRAAFTPCANELDLNCHMIWSTRVLNKLRAPLDATTPAGIPVRSACGETPVILCFFWICWELCGGLVVFYCSMFLIRCNRDDLFPLERV